MKENKCSILGVFSGGFTPRGDVLEFTSMHCGHCRAMIGTQYVLRLVQRRQALTGGQSLSSVVNVNSPPINSQVYQSQSWNTIIRSALSRVRPCSHSVRRRTARHGTAYNAVEHCVVSVIKHVRIRTALLGAVRHPTQKSVELS